ncbi:MAG: ArsR family transcriptional regulator, partial [Anaerolineae bacterium]|nr:ArsR family transcriptional regulator [Anaerolineae bacterium]
GRKGSIFSSGEAGTMQDTRQQILEILKRKGEVTVQELSQELRLTSVTIRHHLEILRSEGYITDPEVHRSSRPGRPRYAYRLTSTAADLFPTNYSGLANALLEALDTSLPGESREELLAAVGRQLAAGAGDLPTDREKRLDQVIAYIKQLGFVARWERDEEGAYHIFVCNCPYHYVAHSHPEICRIDEVMLSQLTGAQLIRTEERASEDAFCKYELVW